VRHPERRGDLSQIWRTFFLAWWRDDSFVSAAQRFVGTAGLLVLCVCMAAGCTGHRTAYPSNPGAASTTTATVLRQEHPFGSGETGFAAGRMHVTGGPGALSGTQPDQAVPGVVYVHRAGATGVLTQAATDRTGRFRIELPAGSYTLVGRPDSRALTPMNSAVFRITTCKTTHVDLVEIAT